MLRQFQCLTTKTTGTRFPTNSPEPFACLTVDLNSIKQTGSADFVLRLVTELKKLPVSTHLHQLWGCELFSMWRTQLVFKHRTQKMTLLPDPGHKSPSPRRPYDRSKQNKREESTFEPGVIRHGGVAEGSSLTLRGELGVAGRREASTQVLEDVKRQAAHQRDDGHLPQERHRGDKVHVWEEEESKVREELNYMSKILYKNMEKLLTAKVHSQKSKLCTRLLLY